MDKIIHPGKVKGKIKAPPSKSYTQRAVMCGLLTEDTSVIENPSLCKDAIVSIRMAEAFGAKTRVEAGRLFITGGFNPRENFIDCGESGYCLRAFSAIAALSEKQISISGMPALNRRPIYSIENPLFELGCYSRTTDGFPPVSIKGPITSNSLRVDGSLSSQFLTGLLIALPYTGEEFEIIVENLKSRPYIDMTIDMLKQFDIRIINKNYQKFIIESGQQYHPATIKIEGDWSGAAFMLTVAAIAGKVTVGNLNPDSKQADRKIMEALELAGALISLNKNEITVKKSDLKAFEIDSEHSPDLFPVLTALALNCKGTSRIHGAGRLIFKESNRANAIVSEFSKLGGKLKIEDNTLIIEGGKLKGADVESHNDHRIEMALAVAGLNSKEATIICNADTVSKSYPEFYKDLGILLGDS